DQWIAAQRATREARSDRMAECIERHHAEEQADVTRTR
ncbi:transcriptional regulator, partial [Burkholderia pseudomallei]|nr:transcriptional regulator [Burkholderia pseudomallei]